MIELLDDVGFWPCTLTGVKDNVVASEARDVSILINSFGGSYLEGLAIYNYLKSVNKPVNIHISTFAMSAATLIACSGDKVTMPSNGYYMIHNVSSSAWGDASVLDKESKLLAMFNLDAAKIYAEKSGLPIDTIAQMMNDETWLTSSEALEMGFVDELTDSVNYEASLPDDKRKYLNNIILNNNKMEINNNAILDKLKGLVATMQAVFVEKGPEVESDLTAITAEAEVDAVAEVDVVAEVSETVEAVADTVEEKVEDPKIGILEEQITSLTNTVTELVKSVTEGFQTITDSQTAATAKVETELATAMVELNQFKVEAGKAMNVKINKPTPTTYAAKSDAVAKEEVVEVKQRRITLSNEWVKGKRAKVNK